MCQLCSIKDIASRDRWPKPLEHHIKDIDFLVSSAHEEHQTLQSKKEADKTVPTPESLLDVLRLLADLLEEVEDQRLKWWSSPEKREMRRRLDEDCDQKKLSALHLVNNKASEMIEAMDAKLGGFVKWTLGMNGGVWELRKSVNVAKADAKEKL